MKKLLIAGIFLGMALVGQAQTIDHLEVGPYEVDYRGAGDYMTRLKPGIDLYKFYGLEKDTVIQVTPENREPVEHGIQVELSLCIPRSGQGGRINIFGIGGQWKQRVADGVYLNGGVQLMLSSNKYKSGKSETLFECGIPLSVEFAKIDRKQATLYVGVGCVPTFYGKAKKLSADAKSGLYVAPRVDIGAYVPVSGMLVRLGGFFQYNVNCTKKSFDVVSELGKAFFGANIGLVL